MAAQVRANAAVAMAYQAMVTACAVAGGSIRNLLVTGEYQARAMAAKLTGAAMAPPRSEERRVGKECRSRWSPYH